MMQTTPRVLTLEKRDCAQTVNVRYTQHNEHLDNYAACDGRQRDHSGHTRIEIYEIF